jgi:DNA-binding beta-propeller fold protein YncE
MKRKLVVIICLLILIPALLYFLSTKHSVSASLNFITKWGSFQAYTGGSANGRFTQPYGVAIDTTTNNIYVLDTGNNRVQEFDSSGAYVRQWGTLGSGNGQFNNPQAIAIATSSGKIYVVDQGNYRVQEFDSSGNYISQWGSQGSGNGQFQLPWGIAADTSGNV